MNPALQTHVQNITTIILYCAAKLSGLRMVRPVLNQRTIYMRSLHGGYHGMNPALQRHLGDTQQCGSETSLDGQGMEQNTTRIRLHCTAKCANKTDRHVMCAEATRHFDVFTSRWSWQNQPRWSLNSSSTREARRGQVPSFTGVHERDDHRELTTYY